MVDALLTTVADRTRRRVLGRLEPLDAGRTLAVDDLLDGVGTADVLRLRHVHLPKLDAAGLIEWDREASRVARGPDFERALPVLRAARELERDAARGETVASDSVRAGR